MSNFAPAPNKPDSRIFASYPMPAKIDLINERPRRESLLEKQLENRIGEPNVPIIEVSEQRTVQTINSFEPSAQQYVASGPGGVYHGFDQPNGHQMSNQVVQNQHYTTYNSASNSPQNVYQPQQQQQLHQLQGPAFGRPVSPSPTINNMGSTTTTTQITSITNTRNNAAQLAADLADKEAKLMVEINNLHQRPYSPFQIPAKIDLTSEQRIVQQQYQNAPSPRPNSSASSTKSTSADLADKSAKLMQEIEEMEKKPFNPQTMVVEREQWFEYPEGRPGDRQLTDSKRRVKDFCSLPSYMYPEYGKHIHEENLVQGRPLSSAGSVHTTIIRSPKREIDNKSPLPFAFDNFTTKGVRGNIASVGAIEPDRPRAPIYPIIKRSPSPNKAHG